MQPKPWFNFVSKAPENVTLLMYGEIGKGNKDSKGITAVDFLAELNSISASSINIRMHSPGGNVFDGMMIYEALKASKARISIQVDGVAASIASTICMAGKVTMAKSAMMMVHKPYSPAGGNSTELKSTLAALDQIESNMVNAYSDKTGIPATEIMKLMEAESWLSAEKCKAMGFCDSIGSMGAINAAVDFSSFANVPQEVIAFFNEREKSPPTVRELERLLRDAGVSNGKAKAAVAAIKGEHRDDETLMDAIGTLAAKMKLGTLINKLTH